MTRHRAALLVGWCGVGIVCGNLWTSARIRAPERARALAAVRARKPPGWRHTLGYHFDQTVAIGRRTHHPVRFVWQTRKVGKVWFVSSVDADEPATGTATWRVRLTPANVTPANELAKDVETDMKQ